MKKRFLFTIFLTFASCGYVDPNQVSRDGKFSGQVSLVWIQGNDTDNFGDGLFAYLPTPNRELKFRRGKGKWVSTEASTIQPRAFFTDGGSVPRLLQSANGFNAWAYGPAYIIHDWVFVARKCLTDIENGEFKTEDKELLKEIEKIRSVSFKESAYIMAETIDAVLDDRLAETNRSKLVSSATAGPFSHSLWNQEGKCEENLVSDELLAELTQAQKEAAFKNSLRLGIDEPDNSVELESGIKATFFTIN